MTEQGNGNGTEGIASSSYGIPPYIPFPTFETLVRQLKQDGLPPQIDKSVLSKFSGGTQGQLKVALRTMGLMEDNRPTDDLALLVDAFDTADYEPMLKSIMERTYPYVFALDLMTATPTMLADAFKVTGAKEDVSRKCRTFFLHAAKRAGVQLGNRILTGSVPRSTNGAKRRPKKIKEDVAEVADTAREQNSLPKGGGSLVEKLLDKFPALDPSWPDEVKQQWFEGFQSLMKASNLKK